MTIWDQVFKIAVLVLKYFYVNSNILKINKKIKLIVKILHDIIKLS